MIANNRLQNKVAGSDFTLPVCCVLAVILWWWPQCELTLRCAMGLAVSLLTTYIIMETNARFHLIRIRSRLMACTWIVLSACLSFLHPLGEPLIAAAFLSVSYLILFRCYQQHRPEGWIYHAFLMLGIGSFCAPVMLVMALLYYVYLIGFLRSMTWRGLWAGLLGLFTPYWCFGAWCLLTGNTEIGLHRFELMTVIEMPSVKHLLALPFVWQASAGVVSLLAIISGLHFLHTNYDDKIRVRMMLYIYLVQTFLLLLFLPLQPACYPTTMGLLAASTAPLIAHYFALTSSWLSNTFFILSLLLLCGMATLNLWMPSFSIS